MVKMKVLPESPVKMRVGTEIVDLSEEERKAFQSTIEQLEKDVDEAFGAGYTEGETAGYSNGYTEGEAEGIEQGKQAEETKFWNALQANGTRTNYESGFRGGSESSTGTYLFKTYFTQDTLKPIYDIRPTNIGGIMADNTEVTDLPAIWERQGIVFDTSNVTGSPYRPFRYCSKLVKASILDASKMTGIDNFYMGCTVLESAGFINMQESCVITTPFSGCNYISDITVTGTIGRNNNWQGTNAISAASAKGILLCLKNYSGTADEFMYYVRFNAAVWERLNAEETPPSGNSWEEYVASLGWNT